MKLDNQNITIYQSNDGKISFNVNVFDDTVWLTQKQMAELFDKDQRTISEHTNNIYKKLGSKLPSFRASYQNRDNCLASFSFLSISFSWF